jgi:hypothetical protein
MAQPRPSEGSCSACVTACGLVSTGGLLVLGAYARIELEAHLLLMKAKLNTFLTTKQDLIRWKAYGDDGHPLTVEVIAAPPINFSV